MSLILLLFTAQAQGDFASTPAEVDAKHGTPVVMVRINDQDARFALDPTLMDFIAVNPAASKRLGIKAQLFGRSGVALDGALVKGRVGRFRLVFGEKGTMATAALLERSHSPTEDATSYDLAGGFEALPVDSLLVRLNDDLAGVVRDIVFKKPQEDAEYGYPVVVGGKPMRLAVQFFDPRSWLDEAAARALIDDGLVIPAGQVFTIPVWFGLQMSVQKLELTPAVRISGLPTPMLLARTREPLQLPDVDQSAIIVTAQKTGPKVPMILIGTEALSHCVSLIFDRSARTMTLQCLDDG